MNDLKDGLGRFQSNILARRLEEFYQIFVYRCTILVGFRHVGILLVLVAVLCDMFPHGRRSSFVVIFVGVVRLVHEWPSYPRLKNGWRTCSWRT